MKSFPDSTFRPNTARELVLWTLAVSRDAKQFAPERLDEELDRLPLSSPDRRLATALVYGILRRRETLDTLFRPYIRREAHQVEPWIWDVLRMGTFQLALMTHIPPHAAIYESVELAARVGRPGAKGFINGILRRVSELVTEEFTDEAAADALPFEPGRFRRLRSAVLPPPHSAEYLSVGLSLPMWLTLSWLDRLGWAETARLGFWFAGPAPLCLRVNLLKSDRQSFIDRLLAVNIAAEPAGHPQGVRLRDSVPIRELPGYAEGVFAVQDVASMQVSSAVQPRKGMQILDLCAAPGGKSTHLAELMRNNGRIVACDNDEARLQTLRDNCLRMGASIVEPYLLRENQEPPAGPFDAALVDVPCSNTGVLGRRPEVRWRLNEKELPHLIRLQTKLLLTAAERVKPGGCVVYSTCSIDPSENNRVVTAALRGLRDFTLEAEANAEPGRPGDGGYWARLRRKG